MEHRDLYFFLVKITQLLLSLENQSNVLNIYVCVWDGCCCYKNFEQDNSALPYQMPQKCLALKEVDSSG